MADTIVVLVEDALSPDDVTNLLALHPDEDLASRVLVPADTARALLPWVLDSLSLGELRSAWERMIGREPRPPQAKATAQHQLVSSLAAFEAAGRQATGTVVDDDPLPALRTAVADEGAREVVVATYPHLVEDTFHTDWASRAREQLHVPVLHLYLGTSALG